MVRVGLQVSHVEQPPLKVFGRVGQVRAGVRQGVEEVGRFHGWPVRPGGVGLVEVGHDCQGCLPLGFEVVAMPTALRPGPR